MIIRIVDRTPREGACLRVSRLCNIECTTLFLSFDAFVIDSYPTEQVSFFARNNKKINLLIKCKKGCKSMMLSIFELHRLVLTSFINLILEIHGDFTLGGCFLIERIQINI